jgi:hypothetical protein
MNSELLIALLGFALALVAVVWAMLERGRADRAETRVFDLQGTAARVQVIEDMAARNAELLQAEAAGAIADQLLARANESFELREKLAEEKLAGQLEAVGELQSPSHRHSLMRSRAGLHGHMPHAGGGAGHALTLLPLPVTNLHPGTALSAWRFEPSTG